MWRKLIYTSELDLRISAGLCLFAHQRTRPAALNANKLQESKGPPLLEFIINSLKDMRRHSHKHHQYFTIANIAPLVYSYIFIWK